MTSFTFRCATGNRGLVIPDAKRFGEILLGSWPYRGLYLIPTGRFRATNLLFYIVT